jgi:DNA-binding FadR family transcriptional regulator
LIFALNLDRSLFHAYSTLRCQLEIAFWEEAVSRLTQDDKAELLALVNSAWAKLQQDRIQIPHAEHRAFHLTIFRRLDNPFVSGLLEAYWDAYEAVDLNTYADYTYLMAVWQYHQQIAEAIAHEAYAEARQLHQDHMLLLNTRGVSPNADLAGGHSSTHQPQRSAFSWQTGRGNGANGAEAEGAAHYSAEAGHQ